MDNTGRGKNILISVMAALLVMMTLTLAIPLLNDAAVMTHGNNVATYLAYVVEAGDFEAN